MLKRLFDFDPRTMTVRREVVAGLTTFLTMAYILAVNPNVLSSTGMDRDALFTTTVIASVFATLVMAFYAKLPFALAPGMGLNAFFAYTVCLTMGYPWQFALTAVLIEGILFILLTATGIRERIVNALPEVIRKAIAPGIGLFIAFIGLQQSGIIVRSEATLVTLGDVTSPQVVLTLVGLLLTSVLLVRKVAGALLIGILVTTLLGIPFGVTHWQGLCSHGGQTGENPSAEPGFYGRCAGNDVRGPYGDEHCHHCGRECGRCERRRAQWSHGFCDGDGSSACLVLCAVLPVGADGGYGSGPDIGGADDAFHAERD